MKQLLAIICISVLGTTLFGQEVGLFYSLNGSKLTGDKPVGFRIEFDQGFALGGFVDLKITDDVVLGIRPGYQKIQSKIRVPDLDDPDEGLKDTLELSLDYFSLPLLFKIHPVKTERFYFIGGPQLSFILESKTTNDLGDEQDRSDIIHDFNISMVLGLGYRFPIKSTYLFVEALYEQGLVNITDFGNPEELFSRVKTQGINITLGFGLSLKNRNDG